MHKLRNWLAGSDLATVVVLAVIVLAVMPLTLGIFRLNLVGKYLTYGFVAVGLVMLWGYGGILSLGQGVFFGLGGYCMAMFLKLEASDPQSTRIQSTPGIPDFMDWNQLTALPLWWEPFRYLPFALLAMLVIPTLLAFVIGFAMFKRRVGGVYFAIITQAVALILSVLIIGQQGYTGGVNGITDLKTLLGWDIRTDSAKYVLYFVNAVLLLAAIFVCRAVQRSKPGTLLLAMRDKEDRVRFSGARTVPPREHGGNCDIKDLSRGAKIFFPVYVDGAGLSVGDLHFSQGDGEITFCGAIEMAGWVHMKVSLIKGGMAKYGIRNPIFKPSPITPTYNDYLIFEGISVDEWGKQHYLDVHVAYRQACLNAIEYMTRFGYSKAQAYAILGTAPVQGHISGVVDIPNACATLWLPTQIFEFDINPGASGPVRAIVGGADIPRSQDK